MRRMKAQTPSPPTFTLQLPGDWERCAGEQDSSPTSRTAFGAGGRALRERPFEPVVAELRTLIGNVDTRGSRPRGAQNARHRDCIAAVVARLPGRARNW
jgi:hypothetical protein